MANQPLLYELTHPFQKHHIVYSDSTKQWLNTIQQLIQFL